MPRRHSLAVSRTNRTASFTLIELLTVMAIIGILVAMTLYAFHGVMMQASRSRARTEIGALSSALESYKSDNGAYPQSTIFGSTNGYTVTPNSAGGSYELSSEVLYQNLTGTTNLTDAPTPGAKIYFIFKKSQVGGTSPAYVQDPFANSYGYFTGSITTSGGTTTTNAPNNGATFFDLWSTGGDATGSTTNTWINNWGS